MSLPELRPMEQFNTYVETNNLKMTVLRDAPVFCALVNGDGEVGDFLRLPYFLKRRNAWREDEREKKVDFESLVSDHHPMM